MQRLQSLPNEYPALAQLSVIGNSWEGKPIYLLNLTNHSSDAVKPHLILISGLRANAFAPVELSLRFAEQLLAGYGTITENSWVLDHFEVHLIVMANPDGRAKAETQALAGNEINWQNNTHNSCNSQEIGVRLNNNFTFNWHASEVGPCDPAFAGSTAGSEPEAQAIMTYLAGFAEQSERILLLNLDSYKSEILSPYLSDPLAENPYIDDLYTLAEKIAYDTLSAPIRQGDLNHPPSYGTLVDFAYGELAIPSLVFSMGYPLAGEYASSCLYFDQYLVEKNITALFRALKVSAGPYHQPYGPEIKLVSTQQNINSLYVEGVVDDFTTWYKGADEYSQVESAWFSIDRSPWDSQATLVPISNLVQDEVHGYKSHFSVEIDISLLKPGNHLIFFQAWDSEANGNPSNPGLVTAINFFISYQYYLPVIRDR